MSRQTPVEHGADLWVSVGHRAHDLTHSFVSEPRCQVQRFARQTLLLVKRAHVFIDRSQYRRRHSSPVIRGGMISQHACNAERPFVHDLTRRSARLRDGLHSLVQVSE